MALLHLPPELILQIGGHLYTENPFRPRQALRGLSGLSRTCRTLHILLSPLLHTILNRHASPVARWAAYHNRADILARALIYCVPGSEGGEGSDPTRLMLNSYRAASLLADAVWVGHAEIVRILIAHGADPRLAWKDGTRLHFKFVMMQTGKEHPDAGDRELMVYNTVR